MIEKIIHQIWLQGEKNIPDKYNLNIKSVKDFHPEWNYILWDEIKILDVINNKKEWSSIYYKFIYMHQKIDFAKYVILYEFGGIYIDIDVKIIKSFDEIIKKNESYELIISELNITLIESILTSGYDKSYNNGTIIAQKKNNVLKKLIDSIIKNYYVPFFHLKVVLINRTTGPSIFTDVITKNKKNIKILSYDYLEPCIRDNCIITKNTIAIHKHDLTWVPEELKIFIDIYMKNKILVLTLILVIILYRNSHLNFGSI